MIKRWQILLNLDTRFDTPYVIITSDKCEQFGDTVVILDGDVKIDFQNEILGISELGE